MSLLPLTVVPCPPAVRRGDGNGHGSTLQISARVGAGAPRAQAEENIAIRYDVRLAGVGGQGLILAGMILGEAAAIFGGLDAVQTQSYAPLVRGAPSMSEVIISDAPIDHPVVERSDLLLALVQDAFDEHAVHVRPGGTIVAEEAAVSVSEAPKGVRLLCLPLARAALESGAPPIAATIVGLGVIARLTQCLSDDAVRQAVSLRVPRDSRETNLAALEAGFRLFEQGSAGG